MDSQIIISGAAAQYIAELLQMGVTNRPGSDEDVEAAVGLEQLMLDWGNEPSILIGVSSHEDDEEETDPAVIASGNLARAALLEAATNGKDLMPDDD